ncbi:MAG: potassium/proton antiporter [Planctomycetota bacterium]|nr:potassium/proton antiporter [Planctomycetota bacterium]
MELPLLTLILGAILGTGALLSRFSRFMGIPAGLLFLIAGMLLGEDGPFGIRFSNYELTYEIACTALGLILFHGGVSTPLEMLRTAWKPAIILATVGVFGITLMTGLGVWLFSPSVTTLAVCLLIGSILASTDAAAVFDLLSSQRLKGRAREILVVESGFNDPMAFVLVFALTDTVVFHGSDLGLGFDLAVIGVLIWQLVVGLLIGLATGFLGSALLQFSSAGGAALYPVLTIAIALVTIGMAGIMESSSLLATYIAGVVIGNRNIPFRSTMERVHDTIAWVSQITMFFLLGLLVTPSVLPEFIVGGVLTALWIAFIARPLVAGGLLALFRIPWRENLLISFAGLRGAVPIILATIPILVIAETPNREGTEIERLFAFIFVVVVVGSFIPGMLVRPVSKLLDMRAGTVEEPSVELELVAADILDERIETFLVPGSYRSDGRTVADLDLPEGTRVLTVLRDGRFSVIGEDLRLMPGDHLALVYPASARSEVLRSLDFERGIG